MFRVVFVLILAFVFSMYLGQTAFAQVLEDGDKYDFDGDGEAEEVSFDWNRNDEVGCDIAVFRVAGSKIKADFATEITYNPSAAVDDSDGFTDILVTGDTMSDDYKTWRLRLQDGVLSQIGGIVNGKAEGFENGKVIIGDWVDVLGTRWYTAVFEPNGEGTLVKPEGELWRAKGLDYSEAWEYNALETKKELPVTVIKDGAETKSVLPVGTKLLISATDDKTMALFKTKDGTEGRISLTPSEKGFGFDIEGIPDKDYFVFLPYAG